MTSPHTAAPTWRRSAHPCWTLASRLTPSVRWGRTAGDWTTPAAPRRRTADLSSTCTRSRWWGTHLEGTGGRTCTVACRGFFWNVKNVSHNDWCTPRSSLLTQICFFVQSPACTVHVTAPIEKPLNVSCQALSYSVTEWSSESDTICQIAEAETKTNSQLPNLSGQAWPSIGKFIRRIGHSAFIVNLSEWSGVEQRLIHIWNIVATVWVWMQPVRCRAAW